MGFSEEEIREFTTEAAELLDCAEKSLLDLDKGGEFSTNYDAIFRALHSIKGAAGMMELTKLQEHMHQLENIFTEQKGKKSLDKPYIDFLLKGVDAARTLLEGRAVDFDYTVRRSTQAAVSQPPRPTASPATTTAPANNGRILIVDDEPDVVDLLRDILTDAGFETKGTQDPKQVLELASSFKPDVVLSDIAMPDLNGLEVLSRMSKNFPDIPVIFISGNVNKTCLLEAIENGVYGVIEKPFVSASVITSCMRASQKHRLIKVLNNSINLIMYQFTDLCAYLTAQGKEDIRLVIERELNSLLEQRRLFRHLKRNKVTE